LVSALRDYVESRGMKFLLVEGIYRPIIDDHMRSTVTKKYGEVFDFDKVSEILKAHCDSNQIELLSLPELAKIRNITASDIMHAEDNLHLDARGIRFFAEAVVEKLNALGWINERTTGL
jgi:lysophospholipase L1-like esterase